MERVSPHTGWLRVDDPVAAALVVDDTSRRYLEPLLAQALRASQLAQLLSVHHSSVLYRMRQFVAHGLVAVERVERRAGRPMTYYRAAAAGYFVPFAATPFESQDTIASGAFRRLQRVLERSIAVAWTEAAGELRPLGLHLYAGSHGVSFDLAPENRGGHPRAFFASLLDEPSPAVWDSLSRVTLTRERAKELQRDLARLLERYRDASDGAPQREYLVRLAMAPLARTSGDDG